MLCFVTQPSSKSLVMEVVVDPKAEGQEILDKVCEQLGIIEVDYFGLQYAGSKGEHLWLNMRNEIQQQLMGQPPYRLQLRVKFFLQPHLILQDVTRHQLYLQVKQDICEGLLKVPCLEQMAKILALIAQAELGDCVRNNATAPLPSVYSSFYPPLEKNERLAVLVAADHGHLAGLAQGSCVYRMLQEASAVQGYGVEWYEARENTANFLLGVGPEGISIFDEEGNEQPRIEYPTLQTVSHHARSCLLSVIDDSGEVISRSFRLVSASAANGLYRCLTEMHSFYRCDTVRNAVTDQFSLDLKGRFVSLFNENTTTGRKYVFDIRRTRQEAYDHYRRILHSNNPGIPCSNEAPPGGETRNESEMMICDCDNDNDNEKEIDSDDSVDNFNVLKQRLEKFQDAMLCRVCMDMSISIAFIPCGHLVCCSECAACVEKCPLCRSQIQHAQQIYLPTCLTAT